MDIAVPLHVIKQDPLFYGNLWQRPHNQKDMAGWHAWFITDVNIEPLRQAGTWGQLAGDFCKISPKGLVPSNTSYLKLYLQLFRKEKCIHK